MGTLSYVGAAQAAAADLATRGYAQSVTGSNISQASVDNLVNSGLSGHVLKSYVDTQDALNATPVFVDAGDATRLHLSQLGTNNGIAGLDRTGKVEASRVPVISTQRWPQPFISPASYHASAVTTGLTEAQLFPITVADPGFTYKLLITGVIDGSTATDGQYPIVQVRQGSTTGQIVARGNGLGENYIVGGVLTTFTNHGAFPYAVPSGYTNLDVVCLGAGGGGSATWNNGGAAGVYGSAGLIYGSTLPLTTTQLTVTVGTGGVNGGTNGTASKVTGTGVTTITGAGGAGNAAPSQLGASPGNFVFHSQTYVGGLASTATGPGNAPGGGGGGGGGADQPGADGAVWLLAYNTSTGGPSGPIRILPAPFDQQTPITGATTLYVMLSSSGSGNVTASTLRPGLMVIPIAA